MTQAKRVCKKTERAKNPPTVPYPLALRAASAATHWQPRVWRGPRSGPRTGNDTLVAISGLVVVPTSSSSSSSSSSTIVFNKKLESI